MECRDAFSLNETVGTIFPIKWLWLKRWMELKKLIFGGFPTKINHFQLNVKQFQFFNHHLFEHK